jgi:hypothetical protein
MLSMKQVQFEVDSIETYCPVVVYRLFFSVFAAAVGTAEIATLLVTMENWLREENIRLLRTSL